MSCSRQSYAVPIIAALCMLSAAQWAAASTGPKWSAAQLADFADVVITGRVDATSSGWDPAVASIYTYITVDVDEVFKGSVGDQIVVKQLGGVVGGVGFAVRDQATFAVGEQVLLYLEARPRDGSLYTTALWQGKWTVEQDAYGDRLAVRTEPAHGMLGVTDRQALSTAQSASRAARESDARVNVAPADAPVTAVSQPYAFLGPFRWLTVPPVDMHSTGQPGLAGGGAAEIAASINRWNAAGTGTRFTGGTTTGPMCSAQLTGTGRVTITFNDPCGEISDSGGTLAVGGAVYYAGQGGTASGTTFGRAIEGYIINNNSATAQTFLRQSGCFQDVQTHELGHVLGLDHSADTNAMMFPTINNNCTNGAHGLGQDDRAGLAAIYGGTGGGTTPPSSAPTGVTVAVNGTTSLTVTWNAVLALVSGAPAAATSYRVDFTATPGGAVLATVPATGTSVAVGIPAGVVGTFYATVTPLNSAGAGPSSTPVQFTIGSGAPTPGPCSTAPAPVTGVTGGVSGGVARVQWTASAGATNYLLQAGSTQGTANLFPLTDLGNNLGAQANVPAGFTAWVRIYARNSCGTSAPVDFFVR